MTTFISYSRDNSSFVVRLAKDLKKAGFEVWLDQLDIPKGARWDDEIEAAVERSSIFMVVLAPESMESQNVKDELSYAIDAGKHILPVVIKPCKIPLRLRRFQNVDFTDRPYKESLAEIKELLTDTNKIAKAEKLVSGPPTPFPKTGATHGHVLQPVPPKLNKFVIPAGLFATLSVAALVFLLSSRPEVEAIPTSAPTVVRETPVVTREVTPTIPPATATSPVNLSFYTEEFEGGMNNWTPVLVSGVDSQVETKTSSGSLMFKLTPYQDIVPSIFLVKDGFTYADVKIEAVVTNNGNNANEATLVCRFSEKGWYEFNISNGGTYSIYAHDATGAVRPGENLLIDGGTSAVVSGKVSNIYTAVCEGSDLTLFVNGMPVNSVTDTRFNLTEGKIGIGASSPQTIPVEIHFDTLTVSEP